MRPRMVTGAYLDGAGGGVGGVDVVVVDQAPAGAGVLTEQLANETVGARQLPPRGCGIDRSVHWRSLPIRLRNDTDAMLLAMANEAEPEAVRFHIRAALRAELHMVDLAAGASFAQVAGLVQVLKPEPAQGVWVDDPRLFRDHHNGRLQHRHTPITGSSRVRS